MEATVSFEVRGRRFTIEESSPSANGVTQPLLVTGENLATAVKMADMVEREISGGQLVDNGVLNKVQRELIPWQQHNFPGRPSWQPLLGIQEEAGELAHSFLKREQNIRINEDHNGNIRDAIADIIVYICDFANAEGINVSQVLMETWVKVRKRDWEKNRSTGV